MMRIKLLFKNLLIVALLVLSFESIAQNISPRQIKKKANEADKLFAVEDYWSALPLYKELADLEPANVKYNNRAGICYYYSSHKTRCIPYFENVVSNWGTDTIAEVYYYLGTSYQMLNKFDKAIYYYKLMKASIKPELSGAGSSTEADRYIAQCEQGKIWIQNPSSVKINNLGSTVNTENPEYAPVISANEAKLIFTSKRKEGTGKATTPDGFYYEDIFIADKQSEGWQAASNFNPKDSSVKRSIFYIFWSKARKIGGAINTKDHDASIALSPDGKKLFMYRDNFIWESKFDGNKWGKPEMLNSNVNEKRSFQPSCSMTADEKYLYIVSDRPGGFGGKDIYISEKQADGEWGPARNAGDTINTEFDEDGPFITPNGKTLYYSSQGHNSMGGYDIFKSEFENGKWTKPQNMGYPTNTGADDIFFVMNANETRAYFASIKEDTYGDYDIYVLSYVPETHLYAYEKDGNTITPMTTTIHSRGKKAPIDTTTYYANEKTPGRHKLLLLNPDKYNLTVDAKGYKTRSIDIDVPNQNYRNPFYQEISYETIKKDGKPYKWITNFYCAYFNVDSVVNADPTLAKMDNRLDAYSAMLKTIDPKNTKLNYKVFTFADSIVEEVLPVLATNNTNNTNNSNNNNTNNTNNSNTNTNNNTSANNNTNNTTAGTNTNVSADVRQFPPILFDFNKSLLREEVRNELEEITAYLKDNATLKLEVYGHTDSKGSDKFNNSLSYKRARATVKYFVDKGITSVRLKAFGKGERQPVAPNENPDKSDNPDGRQKNRRVEFKVVSPSVKAVK